MICWESCLHFGGVFILSFANYEKQIRSDIGAKTQVHHYLKMCLNTRILNDHVCSELQ